ncbi:hypothetical protein [Chrysiogenes arsenatis]|uniref:hypothetical protein n=1 Tax=Chrysiogenes arsenatis TaxID=309797 RepID=UPI0004108515|nr:hypothetical protein [Chrysiogenes arsenatis]
MATPDATATASEKKIDTSVRVEELNLFNLYLSDPNNRRELRYYLVLCSFVASVGAIMTLAFGYSQKITLIVSRPIIMTVVFIVAYFALAFLFAALEMRKSFAENWLKEATRHFFKMDSLNRWDRKSALMARIDDTYTNAVATIRYICAHAWGKPSQYSDKLVLIIEIDFSGDPLHVSGPAPLAIFNNHPNDDHQRIVEITDLTHSSGEQTVLFGIRPQHPGGAEIGNAIDLKLLLQELPSTIAGYEEALFGRYQSSSIVALPPEIWPHIPNSYHPFFKRLNLREAYRTYVAFSEFMRHYMQAKLPLEADDKRMTATLVAFLADHPACMHSEHAMGVIDTTLDAFPGDELRKWLERYGWREKRDVRDRFVRELGSLYHLFTMMDESFEGSCQVGDRLPIALLRNVLQETPATVHFLDVHSPKLIADNIARLQVDPRQKNFYVVHVPAIGRGTKSGSTYDTVMNAFTEMGVEAQDICLLTGR